METYQFLTILVSFIGALIGGAFIPWFNSKKDRESRKQLFDDEKKHKLELFELDNKHKFRLVAIDKRLEAHQSALKYWYKLWDIIHSSDDEKRRTIINEAFDFWYSNCLYLEPKTRDKFYEAIAITDMHKQNKQMYKENRSTELRDIINNNWDKFMETHGIIFKEVELEPIVINTDRDKAFG